MHPRAKYSPASLVALAALGAAVVGGCGTSEGKKKKGGMPDDVVYLEPSQPGTPPGSDGRSPSGSGPQCDSQQDADFISPKCQSCLDAKCCNALESCFDLPPGDDGAVDCNEYATCIDDCSTKSSKSDRDACYDDCDTIAAKGVPDAYVEIEECAVANCEAACTG